MELPPHKTWSHANSLDERASSLLALASSICPLRAHRVLPPGPDKLRLEADGKETSRSAFPR